MINNIIDEKNLSDDDLTKLFLERRKLFQMANSPKKIRDLYKRTLEEFPLRYKFSTQDYASQGVPDVLMRNKWLQEHVSEGIILDIGCGDGYFALELANSSRRLIGVDMLDQRVNRANNVANKLNKNAEFISCFAEQLPYSDNYFDTTILSHMLEHVHNPDVTLLESIRVTKSKGKLIAIVPTDIGRDPTHIRVLHFADLNKMLSQYGQVSQKYIIGTKGIGYILTVDKSSTNH